MIWTSFVARTKKNSSVSEILAKPMWTRQFIENQGGNKAVARNSIPFLSSSTIQNKCVLLNVWQCKLLFNSHTKKGKLQ